MDTATQIMIYDELLSDTGTIQGDPMAVVLGLILGVVLLAFVFWVTR